MKLIPESWKDFILRRKWFSIETLRFSFYDVQTDTACNYSATFFMGNRDRRKVEIDGDSLISDMMPPQNHPFYHNICVPFLKKTGSFKHNEDAIRAIRIIATEQRNLQIQQLQEMLTEHNNEMKQPKQEAKDNVIQLFPNNEPTK